MVARLAVVTAAIGCALLIAAPLDASQLVARNAQGLRLSVNADGAALLTYRRDGILRHVLVSGAVDALPSRPGGRQVQFQVDYTHGSRFAGVCARYDGPRLAYAVAACKAPDGSYWAVQNLPQPDYLDRWFEVSHWTGPLAKVQTGMAWAYGGRYQVLFGRVTYAERPVYGFGTTPRGAPTDSFGRLVYLDSFNSGYGAGWRRENSFVTHRGSGAFCYGFFPRSGGGTGEKYRVAVSGPGVTPIVVATVPGSHDFSRSKDVDVAQQERAAALLRSWGVRASDRDCGPILRMAAHLKGP